MKNKYTESVDVNQAWTRAFEGPNDAFRVTLVGQEIDTESMKQAVKDGLSNITIEGSKGVEVIQVPVIVKETSVERIEVPVIIKEIQTLEVPVISQKVEYIEKPVIVKEIQVIEKPVILKEQEKFEFPKVVVLIMGLQAIGTLGLLLTNILK